MGTNTLRVVSVGTTPMTRKMNDLLERMEAVELVGVVNLNPETYFHRSNFDPLYDFKTRRPDDLIYTEDINCDATISWMKRRAPDVILQSGWSQIWCSEVLSIPALYCLGIHSAPLPIGRGAAILNWKLIEGGGPWGNSLFLMEEKTDTGKILEFEPFDLEPRDDIRTAYLKSDRTALKMVERALPKILNGSMATTSQQGMKATRYHSRKPEDGLMEFDWSAEKIVNYVRALTHPYPGAFFQTLYGNIVVWSAERGEDQKSDLPGTIAVVEKGKGVLVNVGHKQTVWLKEICPEHDVEQWADLWAIENDLEARDRFIDFDKKPKTNSKVLLVNDAA